MPLKLMWRKSHLRREIVDCQGSCPPCLVSVIFHKTNNLWKLASLQAQVYMDQYHSIQCIMRTVGKKIQFWMWPIHSCKSSFVNDVSMFSINCGWYTFTQCFLQILLVQSLDFIIYLFSDYKENNICTPKCNLCLGVSGLNWIFKNACILY